MPVAFRADFLFSVFGKPCLKKKWLLLRVAADEDKNASGSLDVVIHKRSIASINKRIYLMLPLCLAKMLSPLFEQDWKGSGKPVYIVGMTSKATVVLFFGSGEIRSMDRKHAATVSTISIDSDWRRFTVY